MPKELRLQYLYFKSVEFDSQIILISIQIPQKMKKSSFLVPLVLLLLASGVISCQICLRVPNCPQQLLSDATVDPIFNALATQVNIQVAPLSISRIASAREANYTFRFQREAYLAVVDMQSRAYKILRISTQTQTQTTPAENSLRAQIQGDRVLSMVDLTIKKKFFQNQVVECVALKQTETGFIASYKRIDASIVQINVIITRTKNNMEIEYEVLGQANQQAQTSTQQTNTKQTTRTETISQQVQEQRTTVGGFRAIENPLNSDQVKQIFSFLAQQLGGIVNSASVLSVEKQIVAGANYRLTLSYDTSSKVVYTIIVFKSLQNTFKLVQINLLNVQQSYTFTELVSGAQAQKLPYLSLLHALIVSRVPQVTSEVSLLGLYIDMPYFKVVYGSSRYESITVIVTYDILNNNIVVISKQLVERKVEASAQPIVQPQPQVRPQPQIEQQQPSGQKTSQRVSQRSNLRRVDDNDIPFCLRQVGSRCLRCAFKFFLSDGRCLPVAAECEHFNYNSNICQGCYHGYYLDLSNVCQLANYLCKTSNRRGQCLTCFNKYRLTFKGTCVYNAEGQDEARYPQQLDNPLCYAFEGAKCLSCVNESYMSPAGICKIPDPNCETFDKQRECCSVCRIGYNFSQAQNKCVQARHY